MQATTKTKTEIKKQTKENTQANARIVKASSSSSSTQPSSAEPRQTTIEIADTGKSNGGIHDASSAIKKPQKKQYLDAKRRDSAPSASQRILGKVKDKIGR
ncbi:uncharacterized protein Bfra_000331 [Botrytis fragariae]|uniref:Uncharacterized protein n=1 Tax=Botrytis fragariae TaxID=1964551 RepID=A0A8H6B2S7_9HELO|nr:uncharacterized protein Bfra_000331 [Botrytis fragariae]KAF5878164.1 hypothetical protein Bfra_000331 [Botrytis fragariae]